LATFAAAVTHARAAHSHRTDAGHDLTLGQMPVAHQPPPAIIGKLVGMAAEQARNLGLNRLRQKRSRAVAQNLGQRIGKSSWLRELENISLSHGVSLLRWRSGGLEHPTIRRLTPSRRHQLSPIAPVSISSSKSCAGLKPLCVAAEPASITVSRLSRCFDAI